MGAAIPRWSSWGAPARRRSPSLDDAIARARAYEATGVDALFFTGIKTRAELEAIAAATTLPIVLGGAPEEMTDLDYLAGQRVRIALQGHAPFAAATQAVYETLKALREGQRAEGPEGPRVIRTDRPRHARGRGESAQRRISRAQEIDERHDPSGHDPRPGAGRRLPRLGRAPGDGAQSRGLGAQPPGRQRRGAVCGTGGGRIRHGDAVPARPVLRRASMRSRKNRPMPMR